MLDKDVFNDKKAPVIDADELDASDEPETLDDFVAEGDPTEIGESGAPDKYESLEFPEK